MIMSYPIVTVDDREPSQLVDALADLGYEVEERRLKTGDFEGKTTIGEIKRGDDLFQSIVDKRVFHQCARMRETGKESFLVLAVDGSDDRWRMEPVIGALLRIVFDMQINIIPVVKMPHLEAVIAYVIHGIMSKVDGQERRPFSSFRLKRVRKGPHQDATVDMYSSIPGVGTKSAFALKKKFPSMVQLTSASVADLRAVPKIGQDRAQSIYDTLRGKCS